MTIPASAFAAPSPDEKAQNPDYWNGYALGQASAGIMPSPAGAADFWAYAALVAATVLKLAGPTDNFNVGFNAGLLDARNWLWINDPNSPHNKAS
jgi:hypothetical protein